MPLDRFPRVPPKPRVELPHQPSSCLRALMHNIRHVAHTSGETLDVGVERGQKSSPRGWPKQVHVGAQRLLNHLLESLLLGLSLLHTLLGHLLEGLLLLLS